MSSALCCLHADWLLPCHPVLEEVPGWLRYTDAELAEAAATTSKQRPSTTKELAALAGILPQVRRKPPSLTFASTCQEPCCISVLLSAEFTLWRRLDKPSIRSGCGKDLGISSNKP